PDIPVFEDGAGQHVSISGHHAKIMALPAASAGGAGAEDGVRWGAACVSQAPGACIKVMARRGAPWITLVLGDAAAYFDPCDARSIARVVEDVLGRADETRARAERGRERVKRFSWTRSVDLLCECFERSLAGH
ncbi:MAG: hypothetical protein QF391_16075, partial [Myxococcota bacterium]|nr:hypothetical protein [Myxococcota bacterium]